jgi:hypothetical protein
MKNTTIVIDSINPDKESINTKSTVNIGFSVQDVSSSAVPTSGIDLYEFKPNYAFTGLTVVVPRGDTLPMTGQLYYTPVYSEKLSYDVWKVSIDKTFLELT